MLGTDWVRCTVCVLCFYMYSFPSWSQELFWNVWKKTLPSLELVMPTVWCNSRYNAGKAKNPNVIAVHVHISTELLYNTVHLQCLVRTGYVFWFFLIFLLYQPLVTCIKQIFFERNKYINCNSFENVVILTYQDPEIRRFRWNWVVYYLSTSVYGISYFIMIPSLHQFVTSSPNPPDPSVSVMSLC